MKILSANLAEAVETALIEVNNGLYAARGKGVIALMPEAVDVKVEMIHTANHLKRTQTQVQDAAVDKDVSSSNAGTSQSGTRNGSQNSSDVRVENRGTRVSETSSRPAVVQETALVTKANDQVDDIGGGQVEQKFGSKTTRSKNSSSTESGSTKVTASGSDVTEDDTSVDESGTVTRRTTGTVTDDKNTQVVDNVGAQGETRDQAKSTKETFHPVITTRSMGDMERGSESTSYEYESVV